MYAKPTKALFAKAKELFQSGELGWTQQGDYYAHDDGKLCACLLGGVAYVANKTLVDGHLAEHGPSRVTIGRILDDTIEKHLMRCAIERFPDRADHDEGVAAFNDHGRTSLADIIKVLDCAIACAPEG
jgi:hypothetical protein